MRGVILTQTEPEETDSSVQTNARAIERFGDVAVLCRVPYMKDLREIDRHLDSDTLHEALVGEAAGRRAGQ